MCSIIWQVKYDHCPLEILIIPLPQICSAWHSDIKMSWVVADTLMADTIIFDLEPWFQLPRPGQVKKVSNAARWVCYVHTLLRNVHNPNWKKFLSCSHQVSMMFSLCLTFPGEKQVWDCQWVLSTLLPYCSQTLREKPTLYNRHESPHSIPRPYGKLKQIAHIPRKWKWSKNWLQTLCTSHLGKNGAGKHVLLLIPWPLPAWLSIQQYSGWPKPQHSADVLG